MPITNVKNKTCFRVWPEKTKPRYYTDLADIGNDFTPEEIANASICVILNATVLIYFDSADRQRLSDELINHLALVNPKPAVTQG